MEANELIIFCHINLSVYVRLTEYCECTYKLFINAKKDFINGKCQVVNIGSHLGYFNTNNLLALSIISIFDVGSIALW